MAAGLAGWACGVSCLCRVCLFVAGGGQGDGVVSSPALVTGGAASRAHTTLFRAFLLDTAEPVAQTPHLLLWNSPRPNRLTLEYTERFYFM